ncbi:MAG: fdxN element excision recombinase XisF [Cyanobacteria bacterium P01_A01_bin.45]
MRVGYVRVSTGEQEEALIQQTERIRKAGVAMIFSDVKSGRSNNRKEFTKLLEACRNGDISEIVITRIDRLARSIVTINKAIALFNQIGIKLIILDSPVDDLQNPFAKFSLNQMGALAEFELDLLQNRVKHGYNHFREQGKACPQPPFGYARIDEKYAPDLSLHKSGKTHWAIAKEIIEYLLINQSSIRKTIQYFLQEYDVKFSTTGLTTWLHNPVLRGNTRYNVKKNRNNPENWDIRYNTHEPLISSETYREIEILLAENSRRWGKNNRNNSNIGQGLLSGQMFCGNCGGKCYPNNKPYIPVRCKNRGMYGDKYCQNKKGIHLAKVINTVDQALTQKAIALKDFTIENQPKEETETAEVIELRSSLQNLQKLPPNAAIEEAIVKIKLQIQQHQINTTDKVIFQAEQLKEFVQLFSDPRLYKNMKESVKNKVYKKFIKSVTISNGEVVAINFIEFLC